MFIEGKTIFLEPGRPMGPEHLGGDTTEAEFENFIAAVIARAREFDTGNGTDEEGRDVIEEAVEYFWNDGEIQGGKS